MNGVKLVKGTLTCPLCKGYKNKGHICCNKCFRAYGLKNGNEQAETIINDAENRLRELDKALHGVLTGMVAGVL